MPLLLLVTLSCGCRPPPTAQFDPSQAIAREGGAYRQDGEALDHAKVLSALEQEPAARPHVKRSKTLQIVSLVVGGTGGALIGWPVGQALGGELTGQPVDPVWELAAVGGGLAAVSFALAVWSGASENQAVDAHNLSIERPAVALGKLSFELRPQGVALTF